MTRLEEMKALATEEAIKLKAELTEQEIDSLDEVIFDPESPNECIYGMATGNCNSPRAFELIAKCCTRVYNSKPSEDDWSDAELNGKPYETEKRITHYISPIELLIFPENGGKDAGEKIIRFLKDETQTLEL